MFQSKSLSSMDDGTVNDSGRLCHVPAHAHYEAEARAQVIELSVESLLDCLGMIRRCEV